MSFEPDYRNFEDVLRNRRPQRLPLYEHIIAPEVMQQVLGEPFAELHTDEPADLERFFEPYCRFFREMGYDVVTYEVLVTDVLPGDGALMGGRPGPIQSRADFEAYPWDRIAADYRRRAEPRLDALVAKLPPGMKAVGGVGNGVFELAEDLVGLEYLPFMQADEPELYRALFDRIGDLLHEIWSAFLDRYQPWFLAARFGDDLGFKSSLLTNPSTVRECVLPQYRRIISMIRGRGTYFLYHSCGAIFEVMDEIIETGICAKHSNEDAVAPYERWIRDYGDRIGLVGGFDLDFLCSADPASIERRVHADGRRFRETARGYALGSGNSIPDYVPADNYLAMVRGAERIREEESG